MSVLAESPVPSSSDDLVYASIAETAKLIAARKLSPVELLDAYLARIDALDGKVYSFITLLADSARAAAPLKAAADAAVAASAAVLKAATEAAAPRDTADIILSEPIAIRIK